MRLVVGRTGNDTCESNEEKESQLNGVARTTENRGATARASMRKVGYGNFRWVSRSAKSEEGTQKMLDRRLRQIEQQHREYRRWQKGEESALAVPVAWLCLVRSWCSLVKHPGLWIGQANGLRLHVPMISSLLQLSYGQVAGHPKVDWSHSDAIQFQVGECKHRGSISGTGNTRWGRCKARKAGPERKQKRTKNIGRSGRS